MKTYDGIIIGVIVGAITAKCLRCDPKPPCEFIPMRPIGIPCPCGRPCRPCEKPKPKKKPCEDCYYRFLRDCEKY